MRRSRSTWGRPVLEAVLVLVAFGLLGAGAGWLWWQAWGPPPSGKVLLTTATSPEKIWAPDPWEAGQRRVFAGTGLYVVIAVTAGLALGVLTALLARSAALATLAATLIGSCLAGGVMYAVGVQLSPPDPETLLSSKPEGAALPGHLMIQGWSPFLAWPIGALTGSFLINMVVAARADDDPSNRSPRGLSWNQTG